jgi:hypothetical protein
MSQYARTIAESTDREVPACPFDDLDDPREKPS